MKKLALAAGLVFALVVSGCTAQPEPTTADQKHTSAVSAIDITSYGEMQIFYHSLPGLLATRTEVLYTPQSDEAQDYLREITSFEYYRDNRQTMEIFLERYPMPPLIADQGFTASGLTSHGGGNQGTYTLIFDRSNAAATRLYNTDLAAAFAVIEQHMQGMPPGTRVEIIPGSEEQAKLEVIFKKAGNLNAIKRAELLRENKNYADIWPSDWTDSYVSVAPRPNGSQGYMLVLVNKP